MIDQSLDYLLIIYIDTSRAYLKPSILVYDCAWTKYLSRTKYLSLTCSQCGLVQILSPHLCIYILKKFLNGAPAWQNCGIRVNNTGDMFHSSVGQVIPWISCLHARKAIDTVIYCIPLHVDLWRLQGRFMEHILCMWRERRVTGGGGGMGLVNYIWDGIQGETEICWCRVVFALNYPVVRQKQRLGYQLSHNLFSTK